MTNNATWALGQYQRIALAMKHGDMPTDEEIFEMRKAREYLNAIIDKKIPDAAKCYERAYDAHYRKRDAA